MAQKRKGYGGKPIKKAAKKSGKKVKVSAVAGRARKLGLESMGYGRWGKGGRITHRTSGGKLVETAANTKAGQAAAKTRLGKLAVENTKKLVRVRLAMKKAEGRGDDARVRDLNKIIERSQKEMHKARTESAKALAKRAKPK